MIYEDDLYEGDPEKWSQPLWKTEILIGGGLGDMRGQEVSDALEDLAVAVFLHNLETAEGDRWSVRLTTLGEPDKADIMRRLSAMGFDPASVNMTIQPVEQKDWLQHVHENFPPVSAGRFFVFGSHYKGDKPKGLIPLQIDAATAFGSGEHETTKGCLLALGNLVEANKFASGLDMGCGSGILAVAMARLWPGMKVTAVDIDPESIVVTKRHAAINGVEKSIACESGDGYKTPLAVRNMHYDIVTANILAGPLIEMAADLAQALKPGGFCILSGLLARQADGVMAAHAYHGLKLAFRQEMGVWQALALRKQAS